MQYMQQGTGSVINWAAAIAEMRFRLTPGWQKFYTDTFLRAEEIKFAEQKLGGVIFA